MSISLSFSYLIILLFHSLTPLFIERKSHRRPSGSGENDYVVKGETELEALNNFLMKKVTDMNKPEPDRKSDSDVDVVFKHALHKYHGTLLMTCAKSDSVSDVACSIFLC